MASLCSLSGVLNESNMFPGCGRPSGLALRSGHTTLKKTAKTPSLHGRLCCLQLVSSDDIYDNRRKKQNTEQVLLVFKESPEKSLYFY